MTSRLDGLRSLDYFVLRVCERLRVREPEFAAMDYHEQVRLLAYEVLREREEGGEW